MYFFQLCNVFLTFVCCTVIFCNLAAGLFNVLLESFYILGDCFNLLCLAVKFGILSISSFKLSILS